MRNLQRHHGFTLIELIVVIVILAILAVFAIARFGDLSSQSHTSVAESYFKSFETSVRNFYSLCQLRNGDNQGVGGPGFGGGQDIPEYQVRSSTSGSCYPEAGFGDGRISDLNDCIETFQGMLDPAPTFNTSTITFTDEAYNAEAENSDVIIRYAGTRRCAFYYIASRQGTLSPLLEYNAGTGEITISNL